MDDRKGTVLKPAGTDNVTGAHVINGNTSKPSVSHTRTREEQIKSLPFVLKSTWQCRSRFFYLAVADGSFSCFALLRRHLSLSLSLTRYPTATTIALHLARSSVTTGIKWRRSWILYGWLPTNSYCFYYNVEVKANQVLVIRLQNTSAFFVLLMKSVRTLNNNEAKLLY